MRGGQAKLAVVRNGPEPSPVTAPELGLYAEVRKAAMDSDRWRRMHELSDRSEAVTIPDRLKRLVARGGGVRRERGGFKFEERY